MYSLLSICFVFMIICSVRCSNEVPVLAWGSGLEHMDFHVSAFKKLSTSEFHRDFLKELAHSEPAAIVLFVEESLSPEDLALTHSDEKNAFPLLQETIEEDSSFKYLPYVSNPLKALEMLNYEPYQLSQSSQSLPKSAKVLFVVKLKDQEDEEGRLKTLQRHDKVIHELCSKMLQKYEKAVCVLTAKQPSWIDPEKTSHFGRKLLQTSVDNKKEALQVYYKDDAGMVFSKYPPVVFIKNTNQTFNLSISDGKITKEGNSSLAVPFSYPNNPDVKVVFDFTPSNMTTTWQLDSARIIVGNNQPSQLKSNSYIGASIGNSFHTPSNVTFEGENYKLIFKGLQAQYFPTAGNAQTFGPAEDSVYFFTIPILSGLFVTCLLVTIVLIGLTMIFDIKTMDQFDDPKGKSITINASD